jgi:hypothetical protein
MLYLCGSMECMFWTGYCSPEYLKLAMAHHIAPLSSAERQRLLYTAQPSFASRGFWVVLSHGLGARAQSLSCMVCQRAAVFYYLRLPVLISYIS